MLLLEAYDLKKSYGDRILFELPELKIYMGDKIGIVGRNGAGKTTLMEILAGELAADGGTCVRHCGASYIRQFSSEDARADARTLGEFGVASKTGRANLSGGEQTRVRLANAFDAEERLLFADEPTSNLDMNGIHMLEKKLLSTETLVIISHDRALLDRLCNRILEVRDGEIRQYEGNYSSYRLREEEEARRVRFEYESYTGEKTRLEKALRKRKAAAGSVKKAPKRMGNSEARLHKREATEREEKIHRAEKSMETRLQKLEVKEKPKEEPVIRLDFSLTDPPENKIVLSCGGLDFSYGENVIFRDARFEIANHEKAALLGENGAGKSTLMRLLDEGNPAVYRVPKVKTGFFRQDFGNIRPEATVLENLMRESVQNEGAARSVLARLLFRNADVYKKAKILSGGERVRLALAMLLVSGANLLLLDEPTNYLDIPSVEAVQALLKEYGGTVIFVSHDRAFVDSVANRLLLIENKRVVSFRGGLREYEAGREQPKNRDAEKAVLEMKLARVLSRISAKDGDIGQLDAEYAGLLAQLKQHGKPRPLPQEKTKN